MKQTRSIVCALALPLALGTLVSCSHLIGSSATGAGTGSAPGRSQASATTSSSQPASLRPALKHEESISRKRQLGQVRYMLWFAVDGQNPDFEGRSIIQFDWKGRTSARGAPLFLDFSEGRIRSLKVNAQPVESTAIARLYSGHRLELPHDLLKTGLNRVEVAYTHDYSDDGSGLHRFEDPADNRVYLYSNLEPYEANRIFPCFDQPDLKASFEVTVEAPRDWKVIANTRERDITPVDGRNSWNFPPSAPFSTYVFALHAGDYASWKNEHRGIPLRLFARQSLSQFVDHPEWFAVTKAGFDYFQATFDYPYPFVKYDQILVPEFNAGAMENVGAVTFSDTKVYRSKPTEEERRWRADTILHELAHMWFGNLVTMDWWNGLWLNESFATLASNRALESLAKTDPYLKRISWAEPYRSTPGYELFGEKKWAYWSDQQPTTHPIDVPVHDTDEAESNFDGITYSKGAGVLKQLAFLVGDAAFDEGLRRYFRRHAYGNTSQQDFLAALEEVSPPAEGGLQAERWLHEWVGTPGTNTLEVDWSCSPEGRIDRFELVQGHAPQSSTLRSHRTQIAFHDQNSKIQSVMTARYSSERTPVAVAIGKPCPAWINPNHGDQDFVQLRLDSTTQRRLFGSDASRPTPLSRAPLLAREQLWQAHWQSVLEGRTAASHYADQFLAQGALETDQGLLGTLIGRLYSQSASDAAAIHWMPESNRSQLIEQLRALSRAQLKSSPAGSDRQRRWWNLALATTHSTEDIAWLRGLLSGRERIPGLPLDQDRRWEVLLAWAAIAGHDEAPLDAALLAEARRDSTDSGKKWLLAVEAATASEASKLRAFEKALDPATSYSELRELAGSFRQTGHEGFYPWLADRFFGELDRVASTRNTDESATFAEGFYPFSCGGPTLRRLEQFMADSRRRLPAGLLKTLVSLREEEQRCARLRSLKL